MKLQFAILSSLFLLACGEKEDDTATTDDSSFAPSDGTWNVGEMETVSNTCGMEDDMSGDTGDSDDDTFQMTANGGGNYTLVMDEETTLTCSLSSKELSCEPYEIIDTDEEMDMTFTQNMRLSGTFSSETSLDANLKMDMSCEGEGCAFLEMVGMTVPCTMELSFTATK